MTACLSSIKYRALLIFAFVTCAHGEYLTLPEGTFLNPTYSEMWIGAGARDYQLVYAKENFSQPFSISGMALRADENFGSSFDVQIPRLTVRLSTYTKGYSYFMFGRSYAEIAGVDEVTVFDGAVNWKGSDLPGLAANPFDLEIRFNTPFLFNPASGDLLISLVSPGGSGAVSFDYFHMSAPNLLGATADASGTAFPFTESRVLATRFEVTPVPEPRLTSLVAFSLLLLFGRRRGSR